MADAREALERRLILIFFSATLVVEIVSEAEVSMRITVIDICAGQELNIGPGGLSI